MPVSWQSTDNKTNARQQASQNITKIKTLILNVYKLKMINKSQCDQPADWTAVLKKEVIMDQQSSNNIQMSTKYTKITIMRSYNNPQTICKQYASNASNIPPEVSASSHQ